VAAEGLASAPLWEEVSGLDLEHILAAQENLAVVLTARQIQYYENAARELVWKHQAEIEFLANRLLMRQFLTRDDLSYICRELRSPLAKFAGLYSAAAPAASSVPSAHVAAERLGYQVSEELPDILGGRGDITISPPADAIFVGAAGNLAIETPG